QGSRMLQAPSRYRSARTPEDVSGGQALNFVLIGFPMDEAVVGDDCDRGIPSVPQSTHDPNVPLYVLFRTCELELSLVSLNVKLVTEHEHQSPRLLRRRCVGV